MRHNFDIIPTLRALRDRVTTTARSHRTPISIVARGLRHRSRPGLRRERTIPNRRSTTHSTRKSNSIEKDTRECGPSSRIRATKEERRRPRTHHRLRTLPATKSISPAASIGRRPVSELFLGGRGCRGTRLWNRQESNRGTICRRSFGHRRRAAVAFEETRLLEGERFRAPATLLRRQNAPSHHWRKRTTVTGSLSDRRRRSPNPLAPMEPCCRGVLRDTAFVPRILRDREDG
mmetsp:Transcript_32403/g.67020  ORF Transcript_32403/g.67020 Transcript_32403/m.67020 type:complete len:233 (-) Transcript_32403:1595-2293(-)